MSIERIITAYTMIYWPEAGDLSRRTCVDYASLEVRFDETDIGKEKIPFWWDGKSHGSVYVTAPIEKIRELLAKNGRLDLSKEADLICFAEISDINGYRDALRSIGYKMVYDYSKNKLEPKIDGSKN
jgi:hypothetical protein